MFRGLLITDYILFFVAPAIVLIISIFALKRLRQTNILTSKDLKTIIFLGIVGSLCYILPPEEVAHNLLFFEFSLFGLIQFLGEITPLLIFAYIFWRFNQRKHEFDDVHIKRIFDDERFLTALRSSLPKGEKDEELGLDYIPFMIHTLDEKRKRFKNRSDVFLYITAILGLSFIIIVYFFANNLINDTSSGISSTANELRNEIKRTNEIVNYIKPIEDIKHFEQFNIKPNSLLEFTTGNWRDSISNFITVFSKDKDISKFYNKIQILDTLSTSNKELKKGFEREVDLLADNIRTYQASKNNAENIIKEQAKTLQQLSKSFEDKIKEPQSRMDELIKRLVLSFLVVTFFLAILRYIAKQYQINYQQMLMTEEEDMLIRKFYVALKNTEPNSENRKIIYEKFMQINSNKSKEDNSSLTAEESGMLKETINAIIKKIS